MLTDDQDESRAGPEAMPAAAGAAATDDSLRYIEYLQEKQVAEGWEEFFERESFGLDAATVDALVKKVAPTLGESDEEVLEMARAMLSSRTGPRSRFETRFTELRYRPILDEIIEAAQELGLTPVRQIDLVTSTDISCTPIARPTDDRHLLFAGEGTARFCNYWTKAIARVFFTLRNLPRGVGHAQWDESLLSAKPSGVVLAALFAVKYAFQGTLLRFYWVPNIPEETSWRAAMLHSMFLFLFAHEYAHFVAHESNSNTHGTLSSEDSQDLELWCDNLAIRICAYIGKKKELIQVRAGLGALAFLGAMQICHGVKQLYVAAGRVPAGRDTTSGFESHPALDLRVDALIEEILESIPAKERHLANTHIDGLLSMLAIMERLTIALIQQEITLKRKQERQA
jgi:hypothetical protein